MRKVIVSTATDMADEIEFEAMCQIIDRREDEKRWEWARTDKEERDEIRVGVERAVVREKGS
jgi:hypothetical protein